MGHEWHRGVIAPLNPEVLIASSWHGLEDVGVMQSAEDLIKHGEASGAYPVSLTVEGVRTDSGLVAPGKAIVAKYAAHPDACLAVNGDRYRATACAEWRDTIRAVVAAGAEPTGAFSLREGTRALATFQIGGANGLRTQFLLADAFDGSLKLTAGMTSIRVVCANTLSSAMRSDGSGMAQLRHTASLETKVRILQESIGDAIKTGDKVRAVYHQAESARLDRDQASAIFDRLFPPAPKDAEKRDVSKAENVRADARRAMARAENNEGPTLATLWNAATWLVDRTASGEARKARGDADRLDSLLFGARSERVAEVQTLIEVILRDGTVQTMQAGDALGIGADPHVVGRKVLDEILGGVN